MQKTQQERKTMQKTQQERKTMQKTQQERKTTKARSGFSTIELGLVLVIIAILLGGVFLVYQKLVPSSNATTEYQRATAYLTAIERVKSSNGGIYIAKSSATKTSSFPELQNEMGGAQATKDVRDWTYQCPAGTASTITVKTTALEDNVVASLVAQKISGNNEPWTATSSGNIVTMTKAQSNCN